DGVPLAGSWPALYQLDMRLRDPARTLARGDAGGFRFTFGYPPTTRAEGLLAALGATAPGGPEAPDVRGHIPAGLRDVNLGFGIGPVCGRARPFAVTLVEATVTDYAVTLRWRLGEPATSARAEHRAANGIWFDAAPVTLEPGGDAVARLYE